MYFWPCWVFPAAQTSSGWASRGSSLVVAARLLIVVAPLVVEHGPWSTGASATRGFSSCDSRALEHRLRSCGAWACLL